MWNDLLDPTYCPWEVTGSNLLQCTVVALRDSPLCKISGTCWQEKQNMGHVEIVLRRI